MMEDYDIVRIELRESDIVANPLSKTSYVYELNLINKSGELLTKINYKWRELDGLYLLTSNPKHMGMPVPLNLQTELGIARDLTEADKRLYEYAKEAAESKFKENNHIYLEDLTKHAPERLPRGGK